MLRGDLAPLDNFAATFAAARWDIPLFARAVLGVELHPGQVRMAEAFIARTESGYKPAYLTICISAGNRAGKTLALAICVLHSVVYKHGLQPPDLTSKGAMQRWLRAPYHWWHFGILTEVADLVWTEMAQLLQGTHEAQRRTGGECPLLEAWGPDVIVWDKKENSAYHWLKVSPILGGGEVHFRTTSERAFGQLGRDMNGISWDECAFDNNMEFVVNEVLNMRRLSTGGQMVLISTPTEGITQFADVWQLGDPLAPDRSPNRLSLRISTRDNVGFGIEQDTFDRLLSQVPVQLIPQNIDGYFIEGRSQFFATASIEAAFKTEMPTDVGPKKNHQYVQGVDPAISYDASWSLVLDVTKPQWTGVNASRRSGRQTAESLVALATMAHLAYNGAGASCHTAIDATGFGGKVFRSLLSGISPVSAVEFGGRRGVKMKMLSNLRTALDTGKLVFPRSGPWLQLRRQLLGYRVIDKGLDTDAVMALAVAVYQAHRLVGQNTKPPAFDYFGGDVPYGVPGATSERQRGTSGRRVVEATFNGQDWVRSRSEW